MLWDKHRAEVEAIAARAVPGTLPWYRQKATEFQWNDSVSYYLSFDADNQVVYNEVVPADCIVKYAAAVEEVITDYLKNLPFNGMVYVEKIQDAAQAVTSVLSVEVPSIHAGPSNLPITRFYQTLAGYIVIDPANDLAATVTYIPSNV